MAQEVGGVSMLIDAKNGRAAAWYAGYGAVLQLDPLLSLVLSFTTVADAVATARSL
ncbi:hypothetical protein [Lichenifustis flavocetrariae]|uniref:Uncharacterized protein n=1 Tax=Lichenifustis flavocetrariae TaxID=2949735 RepID=A0AA41Z3Y9_9HYPH|nr:hypothetical protein [Lichenifustis flavocetrariae]MCW6512508.1 hypothetical protein [Lichenifustis flavocetrariae]